MVEAAEEVGSGILFFSRRRGAVLLIRRDDKPSIPFPNHLDIPGGRVEPGESPEEAIVREMAEELDDRRTGAPYVLKQFALFKSFTDRRGIAQHIFWKEADFEIFDLRLKEGQELVWLAGHELASTPLAFEFNSVVEEFLAQM